jgi:hypothetical protein
MKLNINIRGVKQKKKKNEGCCSTHSCFENPQARVPGPSGGTIGQSSPALMLASYQEKKNKQWGS